MSTIADRHWLNLAARAASRSHGLVSPNPPVGCAIVSVQGQLIALGRHRRCGEAHAEVNALMIAGDAARSGTAFVTLEPCTHSGRTGPCTQALIEAGIARVVIGAADPAPHAHGGADVLRGAGIAVDLVDHQPSLDLSAPHRKRHLDGRPWVRCKWAQSLDGHVVTRTGESMWISNTTSRRLVHRERGRVDAVLTGIGTVLADDCRLTVRDVPARRTPMRVVIDRDLQTPTDSALVQTIAQAPLILVARPDAEASRRDALAAAGAHILDSPAHTDGTFDLKQVLRELWMRFDVGEVLVESGPRLMHSLMAAHLIDELAVFIAPRVLGKEDAMPGFKELAPPKLTDGNDMRLIGVHRRNGDLLLRYMC